jgi:pyruvate,water dikinase
MKGFKPGEILVAIATTPSIVPAMKKAGAILTDEGGLTCHAAIVSRELKVPCVVGLKIVTDTLTNGDEVEVDAVRGIVNILKRANKNHP